MPSPSKDKDKERAEAAAAEEEEEQEEGEGEAQPPSKDDDAMDTDEAAAAGEKDKGDKAGSAGAATGGPVGGGAAAASSSSDKEKDKDKRPPSPPAAHRGGGVGGASNADGMLLVGGKAGLYHCNYCMRDISSTIRIKCAEAATCPDWDLCADCFSAGVELGQHKNSHPYRVVDNTNYPVFSPDWTATEELLMLAALEQHGMGNWGKVSEILNTKEKTEKACMEHYMDLYLHSYGSILPKETYVDGETVPTESLLTEAQKQDYVMHPVTLEAYPEAVHLIDAPVPPPDGAPYIREKFKGGKAGGAVSGAAASSSSGAGAAGASGSASTAGGDKEKDKEKADVIPGYMPLRGDFDVEHDNEAELILADMEILPTDDPAEKQLKLMVIDVFNRKLDERERRKAFVKEYGLIDYKALQNKEKRKPKDERELVAKLRVFARYQSPQEHEEFVQGILEAKRLRRRIEQLQQYRRLGLRTQSEVLAYEKEKKQREEEQKRSKQRSDASYLYEAKSGGGAGNSSKDRSSRYKKRNRDSDMDGLLSGLEDESVTGAAGGLGGKAGGKGGGAGGLPPGVPGPLNIDEYPGVELLSGKEKELCAALRLLPKHYLYIKGRILRDAEAAGILTPAAPSAASDSGNGGGAGEEGPSLVTMDVSKKAQGVYDFMVRVGWVAPKVAAVARPPFKDISITGSSSSVEGGEGATPSKKAATAAAAGASGRKSPRGQPARKQASPAKGGDGEEEEDEEEGASGKKNKEEEGAAAAMEVEAGDDDEEYEERAGGGAGGGSAAKGKKGPLSGRASPAVSVGSAASGSRRRPPSRGAAATGGEEEEEGEEEESGAGGDGEKDEGEEMET